MISPKKIHEWMVKALEEPFLRAEMHRIETSIDDTKETQLKLIEGVNNRSPRHHIENAGSNKRVSGLAARTR